MQLFLLLLHGRRCIHPVLQHAHHIARISHVSLLGIEREQVLCNVLKVILQDLSPFVPQAQLFHVFWGQGGQVNRPVSHRLSKRLCQHCFMVFVSRWDRFQICLEALFVIEEKVGKFLQGEIGVFICLNGTSVQRRSLIQSSSQTNFVQAMEEIIHTDSTFTAAVPLCENTMQVGS